MELTFIPYQGPLLIIGTGKTAELFYHYFKPYFSDIHFVEQDEYYSEDKFLGQEVTKLSTIDYRFDKKITKVFVAIGVNKLNTVRQRIYESLKTTGWEFTSYIHPRAVIASTAKIGEHCFIMEGNNVQDFVTIGNNNILWSGNHVGHHSSIGDHNFISSHVVISGNCQIGNNNFFGVNSIVGDNVTVGNYNWFSPLTGTVKNIDNEVLLKMPKSEVFPISTRKYFKL